MQIIIIGILAQKGSPFKKGVVVILSVLSIENKICCKRRSAAEDSRENRIVWDYEIKSN